MNGTSARRAASAAMPDFAPASGAAGNIAGGEEIAARGASGRARIGLLRQTFYVGIDVAMVFFFG
jgi:hypothetical protein